MRYWALALIGSALPGAASAEELFRSDFQQGVAAPWRAAGSGDVRLTSFQGNVSMRLSAGASALAAVNVEGRRSLYVNAKIAAEGLDDNALCSVQVSRDEGMSWITVSSVGAPRADAVTLWAGGIALADSDATLLLRLAVRGKQATCWFDDIAVTGVAKAAKTPTRATLGYEMLMTGTGFDQPVDLAAFAPTTDVGKPHAMFAGRLHLTGAAADGFYMIAEEAGYERGDTVRSLPDLDIALVQRGETLLPAQRGLIPGTHPDWNWILEPGRVWSETGDAGLTRAALPFALQERNANCTHNGMLILLFGADGKVSRAAFEIAGETCRYRKFDAWGFLAALYVPGPVADADAIVWRHEETVAARLPVRPVADLPPAVAAQLATAAGPEPTVYGAVLDGIHYRSTCVTRHGDYPACEMIDLPSYSTAKSIFGGVGLMRLEALYPGSAAAALAGLVPACVSGRRWAGVTLEHTLDMATGHYDSDAYMGDEDDASITGFFEPADHAAKIAFACDHYPRKAAPGTKWVYHTSDTYLLGTAMAEILRQKRGADADLYDDLVRPLWNGLKLSSTLSTTRRSEDAVAQPFVGWGLTYQPDDIARISRWLMQGADGLLDPRLFDAGMQLSAADSGLGAGFPGFRYRAGFWARDMGASLGCSAPHWIPAMSGFGGISVAMLPGRDALFYSFGDSDHWDWAPAAVALAGKDKLCG